MNDVIFPIVLGIILIVIGISNMRGNISSLHSYHRKRVTEEDRLPFGRLVGVGTIICGVSIALYSVLSYFALKLQSDALIIISTGILIVGLLLGIGLNFYAMIKYNKGIF